MCQANICMLLIEGLGTAERENKSCVRVEAEREVLAAKNLKTTSKQVLRRK